MSWIRRETEKGTVQYICPRCHDYHEFREDFGERTFSENYIFCRRCGARNGTGNAPTLTPPTEWVSVEDRLPDTDGAYLVYAPTYTGGSSSSLDCIGGIMFFRFKHEKWSIESGYYKRPNCVTHWMPIPTPYDIDHIHISEPHEG